MNFRETRRQPTEADVEPAAGADGLPTDRDPVEVLADEFLVRFRRGERPSIDDYAARHPDLADAIRALFPTIAAMERRKPHRERSAAGRVLPGLDPLDGLGDYRIIREIGRGGMGIVYEAEQESLGRLVAVKILPRTTLLDSKQLDRFRREARTAAKLHHTNIVPVFGIGEHDGCHYYVMQYIRGVGLDRILDELRRLHEDDQPRSERSGVTGVALALLSDSLPDDEKGADDRGGREPPAPSSRERVEPTVPRSPGGPYWQSVARIGAQVAEALDYAHAQGTLHRDIKPANLLLDSQGVVWITDFGLAKALECDDVSRSGDLAGTLRYMAPERFAGRCDARSDLYSLGLTLYELLTLRPAFATSDRQELIRRITREEPPRPRVLDRRIPRDLETIVLKAIAPAPEHRYGTARRWPPTCGCSSTIARSGRVGSPGWSTSGAGDVATGPWPPCREPPWRF